LNADLPVKELLEPLGESRAFPNLDPQAIVGAFETAHCQYLDFCELEQFTAYICRNAP